MSRQDRKAERNAEIYRLRTQDRLTLRAIGARYGLSPYRISTICLAEERLRDPGSEHLVAEAGAQLGGWAHRHICRDRSLKASLTRAVTSLYRAGITTVPAICGLSELELLRVPNVGRRSLDALFDALEEDGLRHRPPPPPLKKQPPDPPKPVRPARAWSGPWR